jgi:hypothetical protein
MDRFIKLDINALRIWLSKHAPCKFHAVEHIRNKCIDSNIHGMCEGCGKFYDRNNLFMVSGVGYYCMNCVHNIIALIFNGDY